MEKTKLSEALSALHGEKPGPYLSAVCVLTIRELFDYLSDEHQLDLVVDLIHMIAPPKDPNPRRPGRNTDNPGCSQRDADGVPGSGAVEGGTGEFSTRKHANGVPT